MTDPRSKAKCEYCLDMGKLQKDGEKYNCPYCNPKTIRVPLRRSWDSIWMNLANSISRRSTCLTPNRQVGCVIVSEDNTQVLSLGYNGSAKGDDNSCEYKPSEFSDGFRPGEMNVKIGTSRCTCVHAEMNALTKLDTSNPCKKKMYLTLSPCPLCSKLIVNAGINEVIYADLYGIGEILKELEKLGVKVRHYGNY